MIRNKLYILLFLLCFSVSLQAATDGLFAQIQTDKGFMLFKLYHDKTPLAVTNFVGLATGSIPEVSRTKEPFYNGKKIDLVVPRSIVVAGCPIGTGSGDAGYFFEDEFHPDISYDKAGMLGMDSLEYDKSSCRFFISLGNISYLKGQKTVFGEIVDGTKVLNKLEKGDEIVNVKIIRSGLASEKLSFNSKTWKTEKLKLKLKRKKMSDSANRKVYHYAKSRHQKVLEGPHKIRYAVQKSGEGDYPRKGQRVSVKFQVNDFEGNFIEQNQAGTPYEFIVGEYRASKVWEAMIINMRIGESRQVYYFDLSHFHGVDAPKFFSATLIRVS